MTSREWKRYLRQAQRELLCPRKERAAFRSQMERALRELPQGQEGLTLEQCCEALGTPSQAAGGFMERFTPQQIEAEKRRRGARRMAFVAAALALILGLAAMCTYFWHQREVDTIREETVIIDMGDASFEDAERIAQAIADEMERRHSEK